MSNSIKSLVGKNFLIKKRSPFRFLLECTLPFLVMLAIAQMAQPGDYDVVHPDQSATTVDLSLSSLLPLTRPLNNTVAFIPDNSFTRDMAYTHMEIINSIDNIDHGKDHYRFFSDEKSFMDEYNKFNEDSYQENDLTTYRIAYAFVFEENNGHISYHIRYNPQEKSYVPDHSYNLDRKYNQNDVHVNEGRGILGWQSYFDEYILLQYGAPGENLNNLGQHIKSIKSGEKNNQMKVVYDEFVAPPFLWNRFFTLSTYLVPMFLFIGHLLSFQQLISGIVEEKELKLLASMKMIGLQNHTYYLSWFFTYFILYLPSLFVNTLVLRYLLQETDPVLLFIPLVLFYTTFIIFSITISTLFDSTKSSNNGSLLILALLFLTKQPILSPLSSLTEYINQLIMMEQFKDGLSLSLSDLSLYTNHISFFQCVTYFLGQIVVFSLLTWYFDQVIPGEYKITKPWYFPVSSTISYIIRLFSNTSYQKLTESPRFTDFYNCPEKKIEKPSLPKDDIVLSIQDISKTFDSPSGLVKAVSGFSMDFYRNQIHGLLGHNGSGKSTLISMLTGLYPPTSGTATYFQHQHQRQHQHQKVGVDLKNETNKIYSLFGCCPQDNILFNNLTVIEHMLLWCDLKNIDVNHPTIKSQFSNINTNTNTNIDNSSQNEDSDTSQHFTDIYSYCIQILNRVGLGSSHVDDKTHEYAHSLSGGQKRKLCIGLALIGNPSILFFDEPSSGLDIAAQRELWSILHSLKSSCSIILTTHAMDEAENLSDTISIMNFGKLETSGSVGYLKASFDVGYTLTITKVKDSDSSLFSSVSVEGNGNLDNNPINTGLYEDSTENPERIKISENMTINADYGFPSPSSPLSPSLSTSPLYPYTSAKSPFTPILIEAFPFVMYVNESEHEISYKLPIEQSPLFYDLMTFIDDHASQYNLGMYGMSVRTLNDVFLKVSELNNCYNHEHSKNAPEQKKSQKNDVTEKTKISTSSSKSAMLEQYSSLSSSSIVTELTRLFEFAPKHSRGQVLMSQMRAMLYRKYHAFKRDLVFLSYYYLIPLSVILLGLLVISNLDNIIFPTVIKNSNISLFPSQTPIDVLFSPSIDSEIVSNFNFDYISHANIKKYTASCDGVSFSCDNNLDFMVKLDKQGQKTNIQRKTHLSGGMLDGEGSGKEVEFDLLNYAQHTAATMDQYTYNNPRMMSFFFKKLQGFTPHTNTNTNTNTNTEKTLEMDVHIIGNNTAPASAFVMKSLLTKVRLHQVNPSLSLSTNYQVLPQPSKSSLNAAMKLSGSIIMLVMLILSLTSFVSILANSIVMEKVSKVKLLLTINGTSPIIYWLSQLIFDCIIFIPVTLVIYLILYVFSLHLVLNGFTNFIRVFFTFYISCLPIIYTISSIISKPSFAQSMAYIYGIVFPILTFIPLMMLFAQGYHDWAKTYFAFILLLPTPNLILFFVTLRMDHILNYTHSDVKDLSLWGVLVAWIIFITFEVVMQYQILDKIIQKPRQGSLKEENIVNSSISSNNDVISESKRIDEGLYNPSDYPLIVKHINKQFESKIAVKDLSFAVKKNNIFGLLGSNGAGKTTSMSMIIGETLPTLIPASAKVSGVDMFSDPAEARLNIGFCPQFDALMPNLTTREHLTVYALIKGIPDSLAEEIIELLLTQLSLQRYEHKLANKLSIGTKRRLSVGIALCSNPTVLMLDEPTTGVDTASKHDIWNLLKAVLEDKCVVLSSHSMEEVEHLCDQIGIMTRKGYNSRDGGQLIALGSAQHLKNKYGRGYQVSFHSPKINHLKIRELLMQKLSSAKVTDNQGNYIKFHINRSYSTLKQLFVICENVKNMVGNSKTADDDDIGHVGSYSVTDTDLDQIFLDLTADRHQH